MITIKSKYKYILTFDIGIKNLAYCLVRCFIEKDGSINLDILYWGIIDISNNNIKKCSKCSKNSYYYCKNTLNNYCKNHGMKLLNKAKLLNKDSFNLQIERLINALNTFYNDIIDSPYMTNITPSYNQQAQDQQHQQPQDQQSLVYIVNNNINNLMVYIENQPVLKNPIMKTISICLFTFFNIKKMQINSKIKSINFISATVKTRMPFYNQINNNYIVMTKMNKINDYKNRKIFCIDITHEIVEQLSNSYYNIVAKSFYSQSKKKDDLADTLLYVLYIIINPTINL